ncbi:MAG: preprotein translocase subunit SecE [Calditrichia bacterium]|nr:preprotein translocase subunit SecE [Calditrichia bacterium]
MINKIVNYYNDVIKEMKKVSMPSKEELRGTTIVVIVAAFIFTVFIWFSDIIFGKLINIIYSILA